MVDSAQVHSHDGIPKTIFSLPDFTKHSNSHVHHEVDSLATSFTLENFAMYSESNKSLVGGEDYIESLQVTSFSQQHQGAAPIENSSAIELGITELLNGSEPQSYTRKFIFEPNTQLILGRSPSSGSDAKARMRQLADVDSTRRFATSLNGKDDGLFANQVISKIHAILYEKDGHLVLQDKQSTHGTFVNGEQIQSRILNDFDRVRLGRDVVRKDVPYQSLEFTVTINHIITPPSLNDADECFDDQDINIMEHPELFSDFTESLKGTAHSEEDEVDEAEYELGDEYGFEDEDEVLDVYSDNYEVATFYESSPRRQEIQEVSSISATMSNPDIEAHPISVLMSSPDISPELGCYQIQNKSLVAIVEEKAVEEQVVEEQANEKQAIEEQDVEVQAIEERTAEEIIEVGYNNKRKRLDTEDDIQEPAGNPDRKRTALIAAALTGAVVGSIGTIIALANF